MSHLTAIFQRLVAWLAAPGARVQIPERRDWFDLPVYHPAADSDC